MDPKRPGRSDRRAESTYPRRQGEYRETDRQATQRPPGNQLAHIHPIQFPIVEGGDQTPPEVGQKPGTDPRAGRVRITQLPSGNRELGTEPVSSSGEHFAVYLFIEADQYQRTHAQKRGAHISGIAQHRGYGFGSCRGTNLEFLDLPAFHHNHFPGRASDLLGILGLQLPARRNTLGDADFMGLYERRGTDAGGSTLALVDPVD